MPIKDAKLMVNESTIVRTVNYGGTDWWTDSGRVPVAITKSDGSQVIGAVEFEGSRKDGENYSINGRTFEISTIQLRGADGTPVDVFLSEKLGLPQGIDLPLNERGEIQFMKADQKNLRALANAIGQAFDKRPADASLFPADEASARDFKGLKVPTPPNRLEWENCDDRTAKVPSAPLSTGSGSRSRDR